MSTSPARSRTSAWIITIAIVIAAIVLPVLYVLSVPILTRETLIPSRHGIWDESPAWVAAYGRPYRWLKNETFLKPWLQEYEMWCWLGNGWYRSWMSD